MKETEQFLADIKEATGKELVKDYGFIMGTHSPMMEKSEPMMLSASMVPGFKVWKMIGDCEFVSENILPSNYTDSKAKIIEFLLKDN